MRPSDLSPTSPPGLPPTKPGLPPTKTPELPPLPVGQSGNWDLIFSDEFTGTTLDSSVWKTCFWWDNQGCTIASNNELEWYQPFNVFLIDEHLRLIAQPQIVVTSNGVTYQYTSGMISSGRGVYDKTIPPGFVFKYGYAEIKARLPKGKGLWPAFWMLPDDLESKPEIDIMEVLGHETDVIHMAFHFRIPEDDRKEGFVWAGPDFSANWHIFAVDWRPDVLIWYVDGVERWRYVDPVYLPNEPMYLIMNLAVGGDWPGAPDASTPFPSYYDVDYVRVWRRP